MDIENKDLAISNTIFIILATNLKKVNKENTKLVEFYFV